MAIAGNGRPGATRLAVTAFAAYGQAMHADGNALPGLRSAMGQVLTANYNAVANTVAYGAAPRHQGEPTCTNALSDPPPGTDVSTIGDLQSLAYAIGGLSKDQGAYRALESAAFAAAHGTPETPPTAPSVEAVGCILNSRADADRGPDAVALGIHQITVLHSWVNTSFPLGSLGSGQAQINIEIGGDASRGGHQADVCFNRTLGNRR